MAQYVDLSTRRSASRRTGAGLLAGRWAAALLVAAAGALHLYLYFDYFHRVHVVGVLFLVNAAAGLVLGTALLVRRESLLLLAAGGYAVGTLAAFAVSTHWGLFGYHERFWGSWQEAAGGVELTAALVTALLLVASSPGRSRSFRRSRRSGSVGRL
jgi:hypothetical protein